MRANSCNATTFLLNFALVGSAIKRCLDLFTADSNPIRCPAFHFIDSTNVTAIGAFNPDIVSQRFNSASTSGHSETIQQSLRHGGT
jgi:hypothetical protein